VDVDAHGGGLSRILFEVKQKPLTASDAQKLIDEAEKHGVGIAAAVVLPPGQIIGFSPSSLHRVALRQKGVAFFAVESVGELFDLAITSGTASPVELARDLPAAYLDALEEIEAVKSAAVWATSAAGWLSASP
jgi:hypothetical protein